MVVQSCLKSAISESEAMKSWAEKKKGEPDEGSPFCVSVRRSPHSTRRLRERRSVGESDPDYFVVSIQEAPKVAAGVSNFRMTCPVVT